MSRQDISKSRATRLPLSQPRFCFPTPLPAQAMGRKASNSMAMVNMSLLRSPLGEGEAPSHLDQGYLDKNWHRLIQIRVWSLIYKRFLGGRVMWKFRAGRKLCSRAQKGPRIQYLAPEREYIYWTQKLDLLLLLFFETGSHYIALAILKLTM